MIRAMSLFMHIARKVNSLVSYSDVVRQLNLLLLYYMCMISQYDDVKYYFILFLYFNLNN